MKLTDYFKDYQTKRNTCLDENQFSSLLMMYPSVLVATADGNFDALEKQNLAESVKEAADGNILVACEMYSELSYLISADNNVKKQALTCIKDEIADKPEIKSMILELMTAMAEASDGVSDVEAQKISELKTELLIN
jgi:tellurite resistance protein